MKRERLSFDSVNPQPEFLRWLVRDHHWIVANYVSRFETARDALASMRGDAGHAPGAWAYEKPADPADAIPLDSHVVQERARFIARLIGKPGERAAGTIGFGTQPEIRAARRDLARLLDEVRDGLGLPRLASFCAISLLTETVDEVRKPGRYFGRVKFHGANSEPLVHACAWMEMIALPVLIAAESPAVFFGAYAPRVFESGSLWIDDTGEPKRRGAFRVDDVAVTAAEWGNLALRHNEQLREAFAALPKHRQQQIRRTFPRRNRMDGARLDGDPETSAAVHVERFEYYEARLAAYRERRFLSGREKRAKARQDTLEHFNIGEKMLDYSRKRGKRICDARAIPRDSEDFVLAAGSPILL